MQQRAVKVYRKECSIKAGGKEMHRWAKSRESPSDRAEIKIKREMRSLNLSRNTQPTRPTVAYRSVVVIIIK